MMRMQDIKVSTEAHISIGLTSPIHQKVPAFRKKRPASLPLRKQRCDGEKQSSTCQTPFKLSTRNLDRHTKGINAQHASLSH